eukprot:TRINITY_DN6625_c0_g1_i1.p1 TRINITY_DN6625_c0_g1~~TRINITY_DN6625_c0_g1_i1.p1  ORF type:complete len:111 (-),score=12.04 TRINITY_DN6625_c0_g1_i1:12-344(-)
MKNQSKEKLVIKVIVQPNQDMIHIIVDQVDNAAVGSGGGQYSRGGGYDYGYRQGPPQGPPPPQQAYGSGYSQPRRDYGLDQHHHHKRIMIHHNRIYIESTTQYGTTTTTT